MMSTPFPTEEYERYAMTDYNTDPNLTPTPMPPPEFIKRAPAPSVKRLADVERAVSDALKDPPKPGDVIYSGSPAYDHFMKSQSISGERAPLQGVARQLASLNFQLFMTIWSEIVTKEGYKPPSTEYEMAALVNSWVQAQLK